MAEIMVKTDDPVDFGVRNIEGLSQQGDRSLIYVPEFLLQCMQNR